MLLNFTTWHTKRHKLIHYTAQEVPNNSNNTAGGHVRFTRDLLLCNVNCI